jgi:hypothetical protein
VSGDENHITVRLEGSARLGKLSVHIYPDNSLLRVLGEAVNRPGMSGIGWIHDTTLSAGTYPRQLRVLSSAKDLKK